MSFIGTFSIFCSSSKTAPESKCPELLANFCDMLLRKSAFSKKLTSDEIEAKLKDVVSLLDVPLYISFVKCC